MEPLKLSKFKLQLRALIADFHELKERERSANEQLNSQIQKQKLCDDEFTRRIQQLEDEISALVENRHKLDRKVDYLRNDNALLERKHKDLKEAINNLLQSRECFINAYEESTSEMKRSIEARDRKIAMMSETINSHLVLFDSIEKEALSVKKIVDKVQQTVTEKENIVAELNRKIEKIVSFEELFEEKVSLLENKSKDQWMDLQAKNKIIMELEAQLEVTNTRKDCNSEIQELQRAVSAKEIIIESLVHEKKALQLEVGNLTSILKKIQDTFKIMQDQDKKKFYSQIDNQEGSATSRLDDNKGTEDSGQQKRKNFPHELSERDSTQVTVLASCQEHDSVSSPLKKNKSRSNCMSESACSITQTLSAAPHTTNESEKAVIE